VAAAAKALQNAYEHLYRGGEPGALKAAILSSGELDDLMNADAYAKARREYLQ
jgi:2-methylisocitrate lyase-like PEP mutase family enzyme